MTARSADACMAARSIKFSSVIELGTLNFARMRRCSQCTAVHAMLSHRSGGSFGCQVARLQHVPTAVEAVHIYHASFLVFANGCFRLCTIGVQCCNYLIKRVSLSRKEKRMIRDRRLSRAWEVLWTSLGISTLFFSQCVLIIKLGHIFLRITLQTQMVTNMNIHPPL